VPFHVTAPNLLTQFSDLQPIEFVALEERNDGGCVPSCNAV
jgi:hypothetical protein